jgi:hypothetical protein
MALCAWWVVARINIRRRPAVPGIGEWIFSDSFDTNATKRAAEAFDPTGRALACRATQCGSPEPLLIGRSEVAGSQRPPGEAELVGTIHQVASEVTAAGGRGIAVACDTGKDEDEVGDIDGSSLAGWCDGRPIR